MTDLTDDQRREVRNTARVILDLPYNHSVQACELASFVLDNVDAPTSTLAEELAHITEFWESWTTDAITGALAAAADRAKRTEHDLAEARAKVCQMESAREIHANMYREARSDVERITAERDRIASGRYITYAEIDGKPVQKGAESNAETPSPADVPAGEAWIVEVNGKRGTAVKDSGSVAPWSVVIDGAYSSRCDEFITLVSRLVPAPRVITNPDELDALAEGAIVRDFADGEALQKIDGMWIAARRVRSAGYHSGRITPVTVLWEPEA